MVEYDMHIHTTFSDGKLTPSEVFEYSSSIGLLGLSITDHDTVNGLLECKNLSEKYKLDFIPGIELTSFYDNCEVHILGYFIDYKDSFFLEYLNCIQKRRYDRIKEMIKVIKTLGYNISFEELISENQKPDSLGRPHVARLLIEKGYFSNMNEVFSELIGENKPGYIKQYKLTTAEAIKLIIKAKGIPVIAHPMEKNLFKQYYLYESFLNALISFGALGLEVYHTSHSDKDEQFLNDFCVEHNLLITGGSDCHGEYSYMNKLLLGTKGIQKKEAEAIKNYKNAKSNFFIHLDKKSN